MKNTLSHDISKLQKDFLRHQEKIKRIVKKRDNLLRKQATVGKKVKKAQQLLHELLS